MTAPDAKAAREAACKHGDIHMKPDSPAPRCDHKFVDSKHCLKCGWVPPAESPAPPTQPRTGMARYAGLQPGVAESPAAGEGLIERVHAQNCGCHTEAMAGDPCWANVYGGNPDHHPHPFTDSGCLSLRAAVRDYAEAEYDRGYKDAVADE